MSDARDRAADRPANLPSAEETADLLARLAAAREIAARERDEPAGPGGGGTAGPPRRRFGRGVWFLVVPVVLVASVATGTWLLVGGPGRSAAGGASPTPATTTSSTPPTAASPGPSVEPPVSPSVTAPVVVPPPPPAPTPRPGVPWPGARNGLPAGLAAQGPGVSRPGEEVTVAPGQALALEVYERVMLPAAVPAAALLAPVPAVTTALGATRAVWVRDLAVTADGRPARAVAAPGGWTVRSAVPGQSFRSFTLRYRLVNAVLLLEPASSGRARLLVGPLWAAGARQAGLPVVVRGDTRITVNGADCPGAGPCASPAGRSVSAVLPPGNTPPVVLLRAKGLKLR